MTKTLRRSAPVAFCALALFLGAAPPALPQDVLERGKQVFLEESEPKCALCHTLADAEAAGEIGPILDDLKPDAERVKAAVVDGIGVMPAYGDLLTEEQIDAVAEYVATVAGQGASK